MKDPEEVLAEEVAELWKAGKRQRALSRAREGDETGRLFAAEALLALARDPSRDDGLTAAEAATEIRREAWPPGHPSAGQAAAPLAQLLFDDGQHERAFEILRHNLHLARSAPPGAGGPRVTFALVALARAHGRTGDERAEEAAWRQAVENVEAQPMKRPPFTLAHLELAAFLKRRGQADEAARLESRATLLEQRWKREGRGR